MSSNLLNSINNVLSYPSGLTDSQILVIKLSEQHQAHGPGRWICNNALLKDND